MTLVNPLTSLGAIIALLVIVAAFVLALTGRLDYLPAALFIGLGAARLT